MLTESQGEEGRELDNGLCCRVGRVRVTRANVTTAPGNDISQRTEGFFWAWVFFCHRNDYRFFVRQQELSPLSSEEGRSKIGWDELDLGIAGIRVS